MDIQKLFEKLKEEKIDIKADYMPFNMLHLIYQEVTGKQEKVHDILLAGLLNPDENHNFGYLPLNEFLKAVKVENVTLGKENDVEVHIKRYVKNQRSIDIFISWKENNNDCAIIIEDKLHNASDQPDQLKDYYNDIVKENFDIKKVVYIPISKLRKSFKDQGFSEENAIDFDAEDIKKWLTVCIEKAAAENRNTGLLEQYKIFFECLINKDFKMETATKIIECLSDEEINELEILSKEIVNTTEWCKARFSKIASGLRQEFGEDLKDAYNPETWFCNYAQFWLDNKKYWIEIFLKHDKKIYLYICAWEKEESITISGDAYGYDEAGKYHYYQNEDMVFDYSEEGINELVKRSIEILKEIPSK